MKFGLNLVSILALCAGGLLMLGWCGINLLAVLSYAWADSAGRDFFQPMWGLAFVCCALVELVCLLKWRAGTAVLPMVPVVWAISFLTKHH